MKKISCNIFGGGGKSVSYLIAMNCLIWTASPLTAYADGVVSQQFYWNGTSGADSEWNTTSCWGFYKSGWKTPNGSIESYLPGTKYQAYFRSNRAIKNYTVTFDGIRKIGATLHVEAGSAGNPIVFEATSDANGLVNTTGGNLDIGYAHAEGHLRLASGTYSFPANVTLGGSYKGVLKLDSGVTFTATDNVNLKKSGTALNSSGATVSFNNLNVASDANATCSVAINGGTLSAAGKIVLGNASEAQGNMTVAGDASVTTGGDIVFGTSGSSGTLTIESGTVTVASGKWTKCAAGSGTVNLNGGKLVTTHLEDESESGSLTVNFNGGTLKANKAHNNGLLTHGAGTGLYVNVGADGGTIDTGAFDITIPVAVNAVENTAGAFTVTGGGSATFSAMGDLVGALSVGDDTELHWFDQDGAVSNTCGFMSLALGAGSTIWLNGDATGVDALPATVTSTATAENKAKIAVSFSEIPATGTPFAIVSAALADVVEVVPLNGGLALPGEITVADGMVVLTILAEDYAWNGTGTNWGDADAWDKGGSTATWSDGNNAIFASGTAYLAADASASELRFTGDATVAAVENAETSAVLTAPKVNVAEGATATVSAELSSDIEKTGLGTLVLSASRADKATALTEGTLKMSGGAAIGSLTLGTDAAKPVTFDYDGQTLTADFSSIGFFKEGEKGDVTLTNGTFTGSTVIRVTDGTLRVKKDATLQYAGWICVGGQSGCNDSTTLESLLEIDGGEVANTGSSLGIGDYGALGSKASVVIRNGGKYTSAYDIYVPQRASASLSVDGVGSVATANRNLSLCNDSQNVAGTDGTVTVSNGGMIVAQSVKYGDGNGHGSFTFNGGTLKAGADGTLVAAHERLDVKVASGGGTIDTDGKMVTIGEPLLADAESPGGGMTFKGGGVATLAEGNTYAGVTTVEQGTTLVIPSAGAIKGGLAVADKTLDTGVYPLVVIEGDGTFEKIPDGIAPSEGCRAILSGDGKSILIVSGNPTPTWIGGASGSLSTDSNWSTGVVPQSGECIIGWPTEATLTVGDAFAPSSIAFSANTATVTISGEGELSGISRITNNSTKHHVFACSVTCADGTPTLPLLEANYVVFSGGINLRSMPSVVNMWLYGTWNLAGDWREPPSGAAIKNGSKVVVSGALKFGYNLFVETGAELHVGGDAEVESGTNNRNRFLWKNNGTLVVTGVMKDKMTASGSGSYSLAGLFALGSANAVTRAHGLLNNASTKNGHQFRLNNSSDSSANTIVLGPGGLAFDGNHRSRSDCYPYFQIDSGESAVLASSADWAIAKNTFKDNGVTLELQGNVTIDTADYDNREIPHTVRALGKIGNSGSVTVKGCGRLTFEYPGSDFQAGLKVQDTATVSIKSGCAPTRSATTVAAGAALEVGESGVVSLGGGLTLADGATLSFNFTNRGVAPVLDLTGKTLTLGSGNRVTVDVSAADGVRPLNDANSFQLTSGAAFAEATIALADDCPSWVKGVAVRDGDIWVDVKSVGLMVIVK